MRSSAARTSAPSGPGSSCRSGRRGIHGHQAVGPETGIDIENSAEAARTSSPPAATSADRHGDLGDDQRRAELHDRGRPVRPESRNAGATSPRSTDAQEPARRGRAHHDCAGCRGKEQARSIAISEIRGMSEGARRRTASTAPCATAIPRTPAQTAMTSASVRCCAADAPGARPRRDSNRRLALPCRRAGAEKVRGVRARGQQTPGTAPSVSQGAADLLRLCFECGVTAYPPAPRSHRNRAASRAEEALNPARLGALPPSAVERT